MDVDKFFEIFTGGNHNVATWTPVAIKDFARDFHKAMTRPAKTDAGKMEVLIKKGKITATILRQMPIAQYNELKTFKVLGWCQSKYKYIVFYNEDTNELRKHLFIDEAVIEQSTDQKTFQLVVKLYKPTSGTFGHKFFNCKSRAEAQAGVAIYAEVKAAANNRGQFYI